MKCLFTFCCIFIICLVSAQCPTHQVSPIAGNGNELITAIGADKDGNAYLAGTYTDSVHIGNNVFSAGGHNRGFVARYSKQGNPVWAFSTSGSNNGSSAVTALYVDTLHGYLYIAGTFSDSLHVKGAMLYDTMRSAFMAKLDFNGNISWLRKGVSDTALSVNGIAVGLFSEVLLLWSTPHYTNNTVSLTDYDTSGVSQWQRSIYKASGLGGAELQVNAAKDIFVNGVMYNGAEFQDAVHPIVANGSGPGVFVAKYDYVGELKWVDYSVLDSFQYTVTEPHMVLDNSGHIYFMLAANGNFAFDMSNFLSNIYMRGAADFLNEKTVLLAKLNQGDGNISWLRWEAHATDCGTGGISLSDSGAVYLSASYRGTDVLNNYYWLAPHGGNDVCIIKLDTSGVINGSKSAGSTQNDIAGPIVLIGNDILSTGSIGGTALFDTLPAITVPYIAGYDAFLWVISCDSISGISEQPNSTPYKLGLYPNPTNNNLTVSFDQPINGETNIMVLDMVGNILVNITSGYHEEGHYQVNIATSHLTAGLYLVEVKGSRGKEVQRLVKID